MFYNFCVEIHKYSALTYDVMKSYLTHASDKKIRNGYITLETRVVCDKRYDQPRPHHTMVTYNNACYKSILKTFLGKGENARFPQSFPKAFLFNVLK